MSTSDRFNIACPGCGTNVGVSVAHVGKKGRCPSCKTVFPITAPATHSPVVAELVPIDSGPGLQPLGLQPLGAAGLQPMATPGLQPLQANPWPGQQPAWQAASIPNPYGQSGPPSPFGSAPGSPFGQPAKPDDDELRLAPTSDGNPNPYAAPMAHSSYQSAMGQPRPQRSSDGEINGSLWGGIGMMVLAVVWFVGGLFFDIIFFYPPILFVIGLVAFVKGLVNLGSGD